LDAGALLGTITKGKLFPYDNDIDLGVYSTQIREKIKGLIQKTSALGYDVSIGEFKVSFRGEEGDLTLLLYYKNGYYYRNLIFKNPPTLLGNIINYLFLDGLSTFHEDVFIKENERNKIISFFKKVMIRVPKKDLFFKILISFSKKTKILDYHRMTYPSYYFDTLKKVDFYGMRVNIPNRVEDYLTYTYGDWKTEKKNWNKNDYLLFKEDKCTT